MQWTHLSSEAQVPAFIEAAVALHRPLLDRLRAVDRPWFFDHWLHVFNRARAYLLAPDDRPLALVTVPRDGEVHEYRWAARTLACAEALDGRLVLPPGIGIGRSFLMPAPGGAPAAASTLAGCSHEPVQLGYVRSCRAWPNEPDLPDTWTMREAEARDLEPILDLLRVSYASAESPEPELTRQAEELRGIVEHGAGWCWVAVRQGTAVPFGMASYVAMHLPLLGAPAALVADLAVLPDQRGRHVARRLQRFAVTQLARLGVAWVFGNVDPANVASRRQAEALDRTIWYQAVRFHHLPASARAADAGQGA